MAEASRLASPTGLRALTYTTLIGLLTATGLRPGEALALDRSDVDLENGILAIRQSKFGKSRFVPVADSTRAALADYAKQRDRTLFAAVGARRFLSPNAANGYRVMLPAAHSPRSPAQLDYDRRLEAGASAVGRGFRIFVTVSLRASSSNGIAPALMLGVNCRSSQHTSVTWMSPTPTGISRLFRNSSNWPRSAWERISPEVNNEHVPAFSLSFSFSSPIDC